MPMQEFFKNIQGKLWVLMQRLFWLSASAMKLAWPLLIRAFVFCLAVYTFTKEFMQNFANTENSRYILAVEFWKNFAQKNPHLAMSAYAILSFMIIFWFWMIRCARRNESTWKKTWIFTTTVLGPIGALIYYFRKERPLEKKLATQDKVMMSFFNPMHKGISNSQKSS